MNLVNGVTLTQNENYQFAKMYSVSLLYIIAMFKCCLVKNHLEVLIHFSIGFQNTSNIFIIINDVLKYQTFKIWQTFWQSCKI